MLKKLMLVVASAGLASGQVKLSDRLAKIGSHLGEGGVHYSVTDGEGDMEAMAIFLDEMIRSLPDADIPEGLKFQSAGKDLGVYQVLGTGTSSSRQGEYWHNRTFWLTAGKHDGLLSLLGGTGVEAVAPSLAPIGTDLVLETELDLRQVVPVLKKMVKAVDAQASGELEGALAEPLTDGGEPIGKILPKISVRLTVGLWLDDEKQVELMPGLKLPAPHLFARLDRAKVLWELISSELKDESEVIKKDGETTYLGPEEETPFGKMRPHLVWNEKSDQLWFSLFDDTLKVCRGEGKKLKDDPQFQAATNGLSADKNNMNAYVSARALELIKQGAGIAKMMNEEAAVAVSMVEEVLKRADSKNGYALTLSLLEDGILVGSNSAFPNKGSSMAGPGGVAGIAVLAGLATPAILKAKKNADKAREINNMRQLSIALIAYDADFGELPAELALLEKEGILDVGVLSELAAPGLVYRGKSLGSLSKAVSSEVLMYVEIPDLDKVVYGKADGSVREDSKKSFYNFLKMMEGPKKD